MFSFNAQYVNILENSTLVMSTLQTCSLKYTVRTTVVSIIIIIIIVIVVVVVVVVVVSCNACKG